MYFEYYVNQIKRVFVLIVVIEFSEQNQQLIGIYAITRFDLLRIILTYIRILFHNFSR